MRLLPVVALPACGTRTGTRVFHPPDDPTLVLGSELFNLFERFGHDMAAPSAAN